MSKDIGILSIDKIPQAAYYNHGGVIPNKSMIYCKLDYWSAVFSDCCCSDIAKLLHIEESMPEFLGQSYLVPTATMMYFMFRYRDIKLFIPAIILQGLGYTLEKNSIQDVSIFDLHFDKIKVDISGDGLIYLRDWWKKKEIKKDVDDLLRTMYIRQKQIEVDTNGEIKDVDLNTMPFTGECDLITADRGSYHVTRCDVAYDLVNYQKNFISEVYTYLYLLQESGITRVRCGGKPSGLKYSLNSGSHAKTVYLGTPQSENLLRIYDKRLEFTDDNGMWKNPCPYGDDVESWIRIELQLRDKTAQSILYSNQSSSLYEWFICVFHWIYDRYAFADCDYSKVGTPFKPESFWADLFKWDEITRLIQNLHYVESPKDLEKKNTNYVEGIAYINNFLYEARFGKNYRVHRLNEQREEWEKLRESEDPELSIKAAMKLNLLSHRMNELLQGRKWEEVFPYAKMINGSIVLIEDNN